MSVTQTMHQLCTIASDMHTYLCTLRIHPPPSQNQHNTLPLILLGGYMNLHSTRNGLMYYPQLELKSYCLTTTSPLSLSDLWLITYIHVAYIHV